MSQLRNLLTNKVLRYHGIGKSGRKLYYKWLRWQTGLKRRESQKGK